MGIKLYDKTENVTHSCITLLKTVCRKSCSKYSGFDKYLIMKSEMMQEDNMILIHSGRTSVLPLSPDLRMT